MVSLFMHSKELRLKNPVFASVYAALGLDKSTRRAETKADIAAQHYSPMNVTKYV